MTIADALKKIGNSYIITAQCMNCGMKQQVKVPKGVSVSDYFNQSSGMCQQCGCATLSRATQQNTPKTAVFEAKYDSNEGNKGFDFWRGNQQNDNDNEKRHKREKR